MPPTRVLIFEKKGKWAVGLRRELGTADVRVYEVRTRRDCLAELQRSPASMVGVELTSENAERVYEFLLLVNQTFPKAHCVVLGQPDTEHLETRVREAGAIHAVFNTRQMATVAAISRRVLSSTNVEDTSPRQAIMARLPWGD